MQSETLQLDALSFRRALLKWYRANARDLPWRRTTDPYAIWLSEIMLQQTRVEQGTPYYERFIAAFPDVHTLAHASEDRVLKLWEGLGYYTRARNLHRAAKVVSCDLVGAFPETAAELQTLPGVGRYTAGAIASIAFGERVPVLDGNVIRVLSRIYNLDACTDAPKTREQLWEIAAALVPARDPGDFNQAMMELGARVCTPKVPLCVDCPVMKHCRARAVGVELQRPVRKQKKETPRREMVAAAIKQKGNYLLAKRPQNGLLGGMWELPGGAVRNGETHQRALTRELKENFGLCVKPGKLIASVGHAYTHFKITLHVYNCELVEGTPAAKGHEETRWFAPKSFSTLALPKVVHKFLDQL
ncbi:MAG: A/G-specific adenine glycosylase [Candidatus Hydrogenedentes bacterium]|nr:A/G-specific adenine glycosylase [Candidatus Hydrogenedentota bacterium]